MCAKYVRSSVIHREMYSNMLSHLRFIKVLCEIVYNTICRLADREVELCPPVYSSVCFAFLLHVLCASCRHHYPLYKSKSFSKFIKIKTLKISFVFLPKFLLIRCSVVVPNCLIWFLKIIFTF